MTAAATAAPDTCPTCATPYALSNTHGAYRCDRCGNRWRATPYTAWACLLCKGATGKRVGSERVWLTCTSCGGTGMQPSRHGKVGHGKECRGNHDGPHSKVRDDGPDGERWQCTLCKIRW